jgi:hypothetical protein
MSKNLFMGLIVGVAFFHSGFSQAQSVVVPLSPNQLAAFCTAQGSSGMANIDLRMPNDVHLISVVDCAPTGLSAQRMAEPDMASATCPLPVRGASELDITVLKNTGR